MDVSTSRRHFSPVPECSDAAVGLRPGWETDGPGLRAHVDAHLLSQLPGLPPDEWMSQHGMVLCWQCDRMVSRRYNGGIHRRSLAAVLAPVPIAVTQQWIISDELTSLMDKCLPREET